MQWRKPLKQTGNKISFGICDAVETELSVVSLDGNLKKEYFYRVIVKYSFTIPKSHQKQSSF